MANPFELPVSTPKPAVSERTEPNNEEEYVLKEPIIKVTEDARDFNVHIVAPNWYTRTAYRQAAWGALDDYVLFSREPYISVSGDAVVADIPKRTGGKDEILRTREDVDTFIAEVHERAKGGFIAEFMEEEVQRHKLALAKAAEIRRGEEAFPERKKQFLTNLLAGKRAEGELPLALNASGDRGDYSQLTFRGIPDEFVVGIYRDAIKRLQDHYYLIESRDKSPETPGPFKPFTWDVERAAIGSKERSSPAEIQAEYERAIRQQFEELLKNGPGRNKIKLELKKMEPGYKPHAERQAE